MAKKSTSQTETITPDKIVQKDSSSVLVFFAVLVLGIVTALVILFNSRPTQLKLTTQDLVSVGQKATFTLEQGKFEIQDGEKYSWYVDDQKQGEGIFQKGKPLTIDLVANREGQGKLTVKGQKWHATVNYVATKPSVVISLPQTQCVYGDEIPQMNYTVTGLPKGKTLDFDGKIVPTKEINGAGVYQLGLDKQYDKQDYNVSVQNGTLFVAPRPLTVKQGNFSKTYDGGDKMYCNDVQLEGVMEGDDVCLKDGCLYFCDKNAGTSKELCVDKMQLSGKDAKNYCLSQEQTAKGRILKKIITVEDTMVDDKWYDGTKSATINQMGTLNGVCDGDFVGIGSCRAQYKNPSTGANKDVQIDNVSLVGRDKDNYLVLPYTIKGNVNEHKG